MERSEPKTLCAFFVNEFTNPMSARQVVESFRSVVVEIRRMKEKPSSLLLLNIWSRTQVIQIEEETTVQKEMEHLC